MSSNFYAYEMAKETRAVRSGVPRVVRQTARDRAAFVIADRMENDPAANGSPARSLHKSSLARGSIGGPIEFRTTEVQAMAQATATVDHQKIKRWVEERGGTPATVKGTADDAGDAGLLRIDFPGRSGEETLTHVSWDTFFEKFDESDLEFLYQDQTDEGETSRFCKFVRRKPK